METSCVKHVGNEDITVLVHFVRISRLVTARGGERKFGDCVETIVYFWLVDLDVRFGLLDFLF